MANKNPEDYEVFWQVYGQFIKEGVAANDDYQDELSSLLRFRSTTGPDLWSSLDDYLEHIKPGQEKIYYILGDDESSVFRSPHLDYFQTHCFEVLTLTDPVDSFMLLGLREYKEFPLQNVADSDLVLPETKEQSSAEASLEDQQSLNDEQIDGLVARFQKVLGDRVAEVRVTDRLTNSVARLVDAKGSLGQELQRVYRMMDKEYQIPKKVLEINPSHPILKGVSELGEDDPLTELVVEQIFDSTLLIEGLHPDPAGMIPRIQQLLESVLDGK
jgi:molecular chaperone HtpG